MHPKEGTLKLALVFLISGLVFAQESGIPKAEESRPSVPKVIGLGSIEYNPARQELTWTITRMEGDGQQLQNFSIQFKSAVMQTGKDRRRFSREEADNVIQLFRLVTKYVAESTVWWDMGQGQPVSEGETDDQFSPEPALPNKPAPSKSPKLLQILLARHL